MKRNGHSGRKRQKQTAAQGEGARSMRQEQAAAQGESARSMRREQAAAQNSAG